MAKDNNELIPGTEPAEEVILNPDTGEAEEVEETEEQKKEREKTEKALEALKGTDAFKDMTEAVNAHLKAESESVAKDEFGFLFDGTKQHQYDNKPREVNKEEGKTTKDFINLDDAGTMSTAEFEKTRVGQDVKSYKERMKAQQKVDIFRILFSQEQQAYLQKHGHIMDSMTLRKVKAKLIRDIDKGRIYVDEIGKLRYKQPVVQKKKKKRRK
jgi:hypothetical protein